MTDPTVTGAEELRETIVSMSRDLDLLRTEAAHARTLIGALDALLVVDGDDDPFAGVFSALLPMFDASQAIVLIQPNEDDDTLDCVASKPRALVGSRWRADTRIARVLAGRIVTTLSGSGLHPCLISGTVPAPGERPALYLPLGVRSRRGLLILLRDEGKEGFDRNHVALARKFSLLASHALAARDASSSQAESLRLKQLTAKLTESQKALAFRANHDQLTGLPNRAYIRELVDGLLARKAPGGKLALAFIDLDEFKRVNDVHGHAVGDALLCGVADRIRAMIRATDILGRISGDEFVVILDPLVKRQQVTSLVDRIGEALKQPFDIDGIPVKSTGSIGVAFYPAHGCDYETLRRNADAAMYRAKMTDKGGVAFFNRTIGRAISERIDLERRLKGAFEGRQFKTVLQAKLDLFSRTIVGFEALLRWVDDQGRIHPPGAFLAAATTLGLLDDITVIQIEEILANLDRLDARFGDDLFYSVNISAHQASRPTFMKSIVRQIAASGRAPNFMLELTEDSFLKAGSFQKQVLPQVRAAGIRISIDDFGAGYSSLARLAEITADELKIDRSFVSSIHNRSRSQSILRAVNSLGEAFNIRLVAEGVETEKELAYLCENTTIRFGQGYLFHKPTFIDDVIAAGMRDTSGVPGPCPSGRPDGAPARLPIPAAS